MNTASCAVHADRFRERRSDARTHAIIRTSVIMAFALVLLSSGAFASVDLGNVAIGARETRNVRARFVDIINPNAEIQITGVQLSATAQQAFKITSAPNGQKVKSGGIFSIGVEFKPGSPGVYEGTINIRAKPVLKNDTGKERDFGRLPIRGSGVDLSVISAETSSDASPSFISTEEVRVTFNVGARVAGIKSDVGIIGYLVYPNGTTTQIGTWELKSGESPVGRWGYAWNSSSRGDIQVSFRPDQLPGFQDYRTVNWTKGSYKANPALRFDVECQLNVTGMEQDTAYASVQQSRIPMPTQDETDTLRQEYVDLRAGVPARRLFIPALDPPDPTNNPSAGLNAGNYHVQLGKNLPTRLNGLLKAFRGRMVVDHTGVPYLIDGQKVYIPDTAGLTVSCGFRCPQRETAILGQPSPITRHTLGRAMDVRASNLVVMVKGKPKSLDMFEHIYPTLLQAANSISSYAQLEDSKQKVAPGLKADHCHLQWNSD